MKSPAIFSVKIGWKATIKAHYRPYLGKTSMEVDINLLINLQKKVTTAVSVN